MYTYIAHDRRSLEIADKKMRSQLSTFKSKIKVTIISQWNINQNTDGYQRSLMTISIIGFRELKDGINN